MEQERQEVYERIPWETLERRGDRQWLVYAVAGAVTLGALAYSFMRNQPTAPPPVEAMASSTVPATVTTESNIGSTPTTATSPVVVAEADLFALDPERVLDHAASYAEWFAVEYVAVDGSEQSRDLLASMLPGGVPLPRAPEGTQVFVDWARARSVSQTEPLTFEVEVLVRSLSSAGEAVFTRQPPLLLSVDIEIGDDGVARVESVPTLSPAEVASASPVTLSPVPEEVAVGMSLGEDEVVGGRQLPDGSWEVVVMSTGGDGVSRPVRVAP